MKKNLKMNGLKYDTIAYQLAFKDKYTKAEIKYPNQFVKGGMNILKYIILKVI